MECAAGAERAGRASESDMNVSNVSITSLALLLMVETGVAQERPPVAAPIDPFDYSYCGGKPVYPVIGINFSTACGPRNQIAVGRRGKLMWLFPDEDGAGVHRRGMRQLSEAELARIMLLAEVAQLAPPPAFRAHPLVYDLGIDFAGRPYRRLHGSAATPLASANVLIETLRSLVPDAPLLPACDRRPDDFNPTLIPRERKAGVSTQAAR